MDLFEEPFQALLAKFSSITHYQRIVASNTKRLLLDLDKARKGLDALEPEMHELMGSSINAFYFYSPYHGGALPYDAKRTTVDESIQLTQLHKNKQYQWLLADAFESFEDFLERMYACAGYLDQTFWPAKDYDKVDPEQARERGLEWFIDRISRKRGIPEAILSRFRVELPNLSKWEKENLIGVDLRLSSVMIEKFRHLIVHSNGRTAVREKAIEEIVKKANHVSDQVREPKSRAYIGGFFGDGDHDGLIILLERPLVSGHGLNVSVNPVSDLMGQMLAHALIIRDELVRRFSSTLPCEAELAGHHPIADIDES